MPEWAPAALTTPGGAVYTTRQHATSGIHLAPWKDGWLLMSPDGWEIARFRLVRTAKAWVTENAPKNPYNWTSTGTEQWRKTDLESFAAVFGPLKAAGPYHYH